MTKRKGVDLIRTVARREEVLDEWMNSGHLVRDQIQDSLRNVNAEEIDIDHEEDYEPNELGQRGMWSSEALNRTKQFIIHNRNKPNNPWKITPDSSERSRTGEEKGEPLPAKKEEVDLHMVRKLTKEYDELNASNVRESMSDGIAIVILGWRDSETIARLKKHSCYATVCFMVENDPDATIDDVTKHLLSSLDMIPVDSLQSSNGDDVLTLFVGMADKEPEENFFKIVLETKKESVKITRLFFIPKLR